LTTNAEGFKLTDTEGFKLTVLICDSAQSVGGKLYVLGAGWSRAYMVQPTLIMALAIVVAVPWTHANEPMQLQIRLLDAAGQPVTLAGQPGPLEVKGNLEVGRPPGLARGTPLDASLAIPLQLTLEPGVYVWETSIVGFITDTTRFEVVRGLPGMPPGLPPRT